MRAKLVGTSPSVGTHLEIELVDPFPLNWSLLINFCLALLAIVNPLSKIPVWMEASRDADRGMQWRLILLLSATAFCILLVFLWFGKAILNFLGVDLSSSQIGGGAIIFLIGLSMLKGESIHFDIEDEKEARSETRRAKMRFQKIFIPMVVPMMAGPGSIVTVMLFGAGSGSLLSSALLAATLFVFVCFLAVVMYCGRWIEKAIGKLTLKAQTRIFGLILAAIAAQHIVEGLAKSFPAWTEGASTVEDDIQKNRGQQNDASRTER